MTEPTTPSDGHAPGAGRRLSANEQSTISELHRLDPQLAGLFQRGLVLSDEIDQPGVRYLIAHIGRELSRAIVSTLTGETTVETVEPSEGKGNDRFRKKIAIVLDLPEDHPNVTAWFQSHQALVGGAHWRKSPPPTNVVRESFLVLAGLLFGRIAPYFDTQAELDSLLSVATPSKQQAERLQGCTLRYTQRRYFFTRLTEPAWLPLLATLGFFRNPPDRLVHEDGTWSVQEWPEGDALARLSGGAPEIAIAEFGAVPQDNQNPAVWRAITTAALSLPLEQTPPLVASTIDSLKTKPHVWSQGPVIELIARLADGGRRDDAMELADALLFVKRPSA
jgi:hypothetical protein